jgi:diguanylate cyclase (GGDEF)-like protein
VHGVARARTNARHRFALAGLALALAAGIGTPWLARALVVVSTLPIEPALIGVGFAFAFAFMIAGWALGRRMEAMADEARRDPMTRVGNRRHWDESLTDEVTRAAAANMPLALVLVDVDRLKQINDRAGHEAGDRALSIVAEVLRETSRSRDVAARLGGDEFALLLPRTRSSEALVLAERIRAELARRRAAAGEPIHPLLTVSIGICDLASIEEPRPDLLFRRADRALYAAKTGGRDRVEVVEREQETSRVIDLDAARRRVRRRLHDQRT